MDAGGIEMKKTLTIIKDTLLLPLAIAAMAVVLVINLFTPSPLKN